MRINQDSPVSIYVQLVQQFRENILSGEWEPGTRLPSEIELARQHNISRGTVRRAMMELVNAQLIERVPGKGTYVVEPKVTAQALIGVVLPYNHDTLALDMLKGVEQAVKLRGYFTIYSGTNDNPHIEAQDVQAMRERGVAGLVIFPPSDVTTDPTILQMHNEGFPFVLIDRYLIDVSTSYVVADNETGGYLATRHLIDLGHTRIGFATPASQKTTSVRDRFHGYRRALTEAGVAYDDDLHYQYGSLMQTDYDDAPLVSYLTHPRRPSAIFAMTDLLALRLLDVARRHHIDVPGDLSIIGFDDLPQASVAAVPLTTIAQFGVEIGRRAGAILINCINQNTTSVQQITIPVQLKLRQSTAERG